MKVFWCSAGLAIIMLLTLGPPVRADEEPAHIRGEVTAADDRSITVRTKDGASVQLGMPDNVTVIGLEEASFTSVDFGVYVGSAAVRLDEYSPIVRDSMSWLHRGFELRLIDEKLRGIALGHRKWTLTLDSIMAHGWVDDIEGRVLSIKYGPTEQEETDVAVPREAPVLKMMLGDRSLIKPRVHVFAGAQKNGKDEYVAGFVFVGKNGIIPPL